MKALMLRRHGPVAEHASLLALTELPEPEAGEGDLVLAVSVCGVCHTELDEIEGRVPPPTLPVVLGHQIVGRVTAVGRAVAGIEVGDRVGVSWIFSACGRCEHCLAGAENLCPDFRATGRDVHGGYAERMRVPAAFAHPIPAALSDAEAAPLLCAGAIGYRSLRLAGLEDGQSLGLAGFGASAHLVLQLTRHRFPRSPVFVFARGEGQRTFARELGAAWSGDFGARPPVELDAVIDTTPAWRPLLAALASLKPGGRLVINAIRKEEADKEALLRLDYPAHLWLEKEVKSVANVTRADVRELLALAAEIPLRPRVEEYPLAAAGQALLDLKAKSTRGAKVLRVAS